MIDPDRSIPEAAPGAVKSAKIADAKTPASPPPDPAANALGQTDDAAQAAEAEQAEPPSRFQAGLEYPALRVYHESDSFSRQDMPGRFHWSVVWADLMMTMFIFFAVLYMFQATAPGQAGSGADGARGQAGGGPDRTIPVAGTGSTGPVNPTGPLGGSMTSIFDQGTKAIDAGEMKDFASMDLASDRVVRIVLTGDLLFDPARAGLKPKAQEALRRIGEIIRTAPFMINVAGHTDSLAMHSSLFDSNWELSVMRATVVARFLIEEMQVPARQVSVTGYADGQPVAPNDTEQGRAANRRVEIMITRDAPDGLPVDYRKLFDNNGGGG